MLIISFSQSDNNTPLHYFCQVYQIEDCTEVGELLIEKGGKAIVNSVNKVGETPLHSNF